MKSFKNNLLNITIMKVDDCVKINGGKSKRCEGTIQSLMNTFALVRISKNKKGMAVFGEKPTKVKKAYIEVISAPPLEMPTQGDLKPVDNLDPNKDIFDLIDKKIVNNNNVSFVEEEVSDSSSDHENSNPNELSKQKTKEELAHQGYMVNEHNVKQPIISIDDAINLKDENWKLKIQLESMLSFQSEWVQCESELKLIIKKQQEQLDDSVEKEFLENLKDDLKEIVDKL
jgi:hypothetical protein